MLAVSIWISNIGVGFFPPRFYGLRTCLPAHGVFWVCFRKTPPRFRGVGSRFLPSRFRSLHAQFRPCRVECVRFQSAAIWILNVRPRFLSSRFDSLVAQFPATGERIVECVRDEYRNAHFYPAAFLRWSVDVCL